jgi:uncharacterized membrane protein
MSAFHALLMVHIGTGTIALISGPVPMLSRKGSRLHRRVGMVYAWSMTIAASSAFALALALGSARFLGLAALTLFLIFVGVRAIRFQRNHKPSNVDKIACLASGLISVWLFWRGILSGDAISIFFGLGGTALAWRQWYRLGNPATNWLAAHLTSMGAGYVATLTAFLALNMRFLPTVVVFILPTLVGIPVLRSAAFRYGDRPVQIS